MSLAGVGAGCRVGRQASVLLRVQRYFLGAAKAERGAVKSAKHFLEVMRGGGSEEWEV